MIERARRRSPDPAARPTAGLPSLAGRLGVPTPPPRSPQDRAPYYVILVLSTRRPAARRRRSPMLGLSHQALPHGVLVQVVNLRLPEALGLDLYRMARRLPQTPFAVAA